MDYINSIKEDMYAAMKSGDKNTIQALRTLLAKLKDKQINLQRALRGDECISLIKTLVKQRNEAAALYIKANRTTLADKEMREIDILNRYLPKMMQENQIRSLIAEVIIEVEAVKISDIGKVMPIVMKRGKGSIDGKLANNIIRELLD
mgnify:FL=1